ncbi:amidase family protein [Falsiroseomonas tokyonensis]|uniref:Amidase family protein n=1 Tax=Falsiroseomonas tokyonensis TaxID=430521 RepID=A0ABV7C225_9PROT|nr:amidase family protein [Falsiroseomonas tokyonensis]MBU8540510.1 amidase family protein [Falsiroseomonas tokyonensis]
MTEYWRLPATEIAALVRSRQVSAAEVARDALARLDAANPAINAVVDHRPEDVLGQAAVIDAALARGEDPGPMAGVPVTIKVNVDQTGYATTNGLRIQKNLVAKQDNPVVANFRKAGVVLLGRTNTPAFSLRWFCRNGIHGHTKNPRDPGITPGGSSGGAAAAVAAGIGAVGHGTDIGGSIRYPAYACGVHGLRPTLGRIPAWNASGAERHVGGQLMAVSGPIARTIADLRLSFAAMSQRDVRDPWWVEAAHAGPPVEKRAALCIRPEGLATVPEVEAALRDAARRLEADGWVVEEVDCPPLREPASIQAMLWLAESRRGANAAYRQEADPDADFVLAQMEALCPEPDLNAFMDGLQKRAGFVRAWMAFFERYPVAITPVSAELPFPDQDDVSSPARFRQVMEAQLTQVGLPLMGLPGLVVTTGLVGRVPVGAQLLAGRYREDILFAAAEVIEAAGVPASPVDPFAG